MMLRFILAYIEVIGSNLQVAAEVQHRKRIALEVFAAGGRYDQLVKKFSIPEFHGFQSTYTSFDNESTPQRICAAGVSIAIEKVSFLVLP